MGKRLQVNGIIGGGVFALVEQFFPMSSFLFFLADTCSSRGIGTGQSLWQLQTVGGSVLILWQSVHAYSEYMAQPIATPPPRLDSPGFTSIEECGGNPRL